MITKKPINFEKIILLISMLVLIFGVLFNFIPFNEWTLLAGIIFGGYSIILVEREKL